MTLVDRAGRTWTFENYDSPSGPAFCITIPDELTHDAFSGMTVHFNGKVQVDSDE